MKSLIAFVRWVLFDRDIPIIIISDCLDNNARGRVMVRQSSLLPGSSITFIGVTNDIEASLCLIDVLDALEGRTGVILVNVAPRNGVAKRWPNGTPFGEVKIGRIKIFCTIDGFPLRFLADILGQQVKVLVYDIPTVVPHLGVTAQVQKWIVNSQFRSFDFLLRLVKARVKGKKLPYTLMEVEPKKNRLCLIAFKDVFGNLKTSIFDRSEFTHGQNVWMRVGDINTRVKFYSRLKDVPNCELAVVVGSSGLGELRFLEIVLQGGSASGRLGHPQVGTLVEIW